MTFRAMTHWLAFATYLAIFFTLPFALLWDTTGLAVGGALVVAFLFQLGWRGAERIGERLGASPLTRAEAPELYAMVEEYCRRLSLARPSLHVIETAAVNFAVYGFTRARCHLVVTRGALETLKREEIGALVGRELSYLWYGDVIGESWLSQFLAVLDRFVTPRRVEHSSVRRAYPFRLFLRHALLYPLALVPAYFLKGATDAAKLDLQSTRITRKPHALASGLRRAEALMERLPFLVPFSTRHLFLLPPPAQDPLARVFFGGDDIGARVKNVEKKLTRTVALS